MSNVPGGWLTRRGGRKLRTASKGDAFSSHRTSDSPACSLAVCSSNAVRISTTKGKIQRRLSIAFVESRLPAPPPSCADAHLVRQKNRTHWPKQREGRPARSASSPHWTGTAWLHWARSQMPPRPARPAYEIHSAKLTRCKSTAVQAETANAVHHTSCWATFLRRASYTVLLSGGTWSQ